MTDKNHEMDENSDKNPSPKEPEVAPGSKTESDEVKEPAEDLTSDDTMLEELEAHLTEEECEERLATAEGLRLQGNAFFREQEWDSAALKYTAALKECPVRNKKERAVLFANRAATKAKLGSKKAAVQDCDRAIALDSTYLKAYIRRATLQEELEKFDEAAEDVNRALELDPKNRELIQTLPRLQAKINERNEKLKEDAMKSLKSIGNMFLKPFGMSTDNFQMTPNETGGYSINFVQNQQASSKQN